MVLVCFDVVGLGDFVGFCWGLLILIVFLVYEVFVGFVLFVLFGVCFIVWNIYFLKWGGFGGGVGLDIFFWLD